MASSVPTNKSNVNSTECTNDHIPPINPLNGKPFSQRYFDLVQSRAALPISSQKENFMDMVAKNQIVVLVGETGSGKTTQVPQWCVDYAKGVGGKVACTQPRRVAAVSVAQRVANEMDVKLGEEVGYTIRFDDCSNTHTVLKYLTDGMLLRESISDPDLSEYACLILDEAHERTVATDVLLALAKAICGRRKDLKFIVMSATMQAERFSSYLRDAPMMRVPGRMFPVEIMYMPKPVKDYVTAAVATVMQIHRGPMEGDVLVFMTGEEEIEEACAKIRQAAEPYAQSHGGILVVPLYSSLPYHLQMRAFEPIAGCAGHSERRKVVVATNVAETSVTIEGVVFIVDAGLVKQRIYHPRIRADSLLVTAISQASAEQRAGRAGRTRPGVCYRLYPERVYEALDEHTVPEILRSSLGSVVLQLKAIGIDNLVDFDFMDPPAPEVMMRALEFLHHLGALDDEGALTSLGRTLSLFPLDPDLAKVLVTSCQLGCSEEILSIVAMLTGPRLFLRPKGLEIEARRAKAQFHSPDGDFHTLLNVYNAYCNVTGDVKKWCFHNFLSATSLKSASDVRAQLAAIVQRHGLVFDRSIKGDLGSQEPIICSLVSGLFMHIAYRSTQGYVTVKDSQQVMLHPSTSLSGRPDWLLYQEVLITPKSFVRTLTGIDGMLLVELAPGYYNEKDFPPGEVRKAIQRLHKRAKRKAKASARGNAAMSP